MVQRICPFVLLTFALTFSNEAGLISEKHIKNTSWIEKITKLKSIALFVLPHSQYQCKKGDVVYHNILAL